MKAFLIGVLILNGIHPPTCFGICMTPVCTFVKVQLKRGLRTAMSISSEGNAYLQVKILFSAIHLIFYVSAK